jgi:hypothetical protein
MKEIAAVVADSAYADINSILEAKFRGSSTCPDFFILYILCGKASVPYRFHGSDR